jgi:hypothetical protein
VSEYPLGAGLRTVDAPHAAAEPGRQLVHRFARRGEEQVMTLRCVETHGGFSVECEVNPVGGLDPATRGPYAFATETEARQFVDEATLALQYLGCDVFES